MNFSEEDFPWEKPAAITAPEWIIGPSCGGQVTGQRLYHVRSQAAPGQVTAPGEEHPDFLCRSRQASHTKPESGEWPYTTLEPRHVVTKSHT